MSTKSSKSTTTRKPRTPKTEKPSNVTASQAAEVQPQDIPTPVVEHEKLVVLPDPRDVQHYMSDMAKAALAAVVDVEPVVGCVVLSGDLSYTGIVIEVGTETPDLVKVYWHKWGPEEHHPDNDSLTGWEIGKNLKVLNHAIPGLWWPKPKPASDNPEVIDVSVEGQEFADFVKAEVDAAKALTTPRDERKARQESRAHGLTETFAEQLEAVKKHLPADGLVNENNIDTQTGLGLMVVRTCLSRLKKDGFLRYDLKMDEFWVLSAEELNRLNDRPVDLNTGKKIPQPKAAKPVRTPKEKAQPHVCACGCGQMCKTGTSYFMMGHDARAKGYLIKVMKGEMKDFKPTERLAEYVADHVEWWDRFATVFVKAAEPVAEGVNAAVELEQDPQ